MRLLLVVVFAMLHHHQPLRVGLTNVRTLDLSADGARVAAGGEDGAVVVERATGKVLLRVPDGTYVRGVALSADGRRVVVTLDTGARLYDVDSGKLLQTLKGKMGRVARCGDGYLLAGLAGVLVDGELRPREELALPGDWGIHGSVACRGQRQVLVARNELFVYEAGKLARRLPIDSADVNGIVDVALSDEHLAAMSNMGSVWLYGHDGVLRAQVPLIGGQAQGLSFSPDGKTLFAGVALLSVPDLAVKARTPGSASPRFTPDGKWVVTARTWDLDVLEVAALADAPVGHENTAYSMAIDPTGSLLASGAGGRIYLWDLTAGKPGVGMGPLVGVIDAHSGGVFGRVAVAFYGNRLISTGGGSVAMWDLASRKRIAAWSAGVGEQLESEMPLSVDASHIAVAGHERVHVFDHGGRRVSAIALPDGWKEPWGVALHPDGKHLVIASRNRHLGVFDRVSGKLVAELPRGASNESAVALSPDGKTVVDFQRDGVKLWQWPGLRPGPRLEGADADGVAWSADGRSVAWASWGGEVGVFDLARGKLLWKTTTPWHSAGVAWDDRRGLIYSSGADLSIFAWDARTGQRRATWAGGPGDHIDHLALANGSDLVTFQSEIGSLRVWDLGTLQQTFEARPVYGMDKVAPRLVGDRLVAWDHEGRLRRWQRQGGKWRELAKWSVGAPFDWRGIGITRDGKTAYVIGDGELWTLDAETARVTAKQKIALRAGELGRFAFDPDSARLAVDGSDEDTLDVWELSAPSKRPRRAKAERDAVWLHGDLVFGTEPRQRWSPATGKTTVLCPKDDFRNLLGTSADGTRAVWLRGALLVRDTAACTGEVALYATGDEQVATVDGDRLVVAADGKVTVWDLKAGAPVAVLQALRDGLWVSEPRPRP